MEYSNPKRMLKKNTFGMSNEKRTIPIRDLKEIKKESNAKRDESK